MPATLCGRKRRRSTPGSSSRQFETAEQHRERRRCYLHVRLVRERPTGERPAWSRSKPRPRQQGVQMATLHFHETTTSTPDEFVAGLTDFGPGRSELFGNSDDGYLK